GKHSNNALDCLRGIYRVQGREDEVPRLGCFQSNLNRFFVAHFPHQDHLWRLPQSRAQSKSEIGSVTVQFSLMDDGALVAVHEFHRILDGHNVVGLCLIDPVHNRCQGRRLTRTGWASNQHNSVSQFGDLGQLQGQLELCKTGNALRHNPHHDRVAAPLPEDVDTKTTLAWQAV